MLFGIVSKLQKLYIKGKKSLPLESSIKNSFHLCSPGNMFCNIVKPFLDLLVVLDLYIPN